MKLHDLSDRTCGCDESEGAPGLTSLNEALALCAAETPLVPGVDMLPIGEALGRCLSEPVMSRVNVPPFANSAVDGYAVRCGDLIGPGPCILPVVDRTAAGDAPAQLDRIATVRIFTGAPLPAGANAVVAQEHVTLRNGIARFDRLPTVGANVRRAGEDMAAGDVILPAGRRIGPRDIAMMAAAGVAEVRVRRRLRIALLITGSELVAPGQEAAPGKINDVNGPMLEALIAQPGVSIVEKARIGDDLGRLCAELERLSGAVDLIVTTGGVSVGEEDYLRRAVERIGDRLHFAGVALKPGKPVSFGRIGTALWLGLPGNPQASFVGWHLFGRAIVDALQGATGKPRKMIVSSAVNLRHKPGRCELRPARLVGFDLRGRATVTAEAATYSGRVSPLADADGLLLLPSEADQIDTSMLLEFLPFEES
ncbi:gephyrin-like molybdotransferase Glp [Mameliella alba]|uniref:molybdopterin molybdotransferase MoeA n=1 Tax=Mameliella alba TaxID=561184 RepID=UPI000B534040|nr:gephyrin-like molybdotransferase Glp [Mameliella alba]MBY6122006.1 molybdopterin molybdotransferase MoeA [Mameliella alba]OWV40030.1 molybdopterin molybdenumtransferase MoeA [Mameliella alba]OWV58406.1 molybdopterin molybdenumtransferase MoeA [Mameliella alba]